MLIWYSTHFSALSAGRPAVFPRPLKHLLHRIKCLEERQQLRSSDFFVIFVIQKFWGGLGQVPNWGVAIQRSWVVNGMRSTCLHNSPRETRTVKHSGLFLQWTKLTPVHLEGLSGYCLITWWSFALLEPALIRFPYPEHGFSQQNPFSWKRSQSLCRRHSPCKRVWYSHPLSFVEIIVKLPTFEPARGAD